MNSPMYTHQGLERLERGFAALTHASHAISHWLAKTLHDYAAQRRQRRQDQQMMELAHHDPRVMADIQAAILRAENINEDRPAARSR